MRIPRYQQCECGHLGDQHTEDGSCARCECGRFQHPIMRHASFAGERQRPHFRPNPVSQPTRDSGTR